MIKRTPKYNLNFIRQTFQETESLVMSSKARRQLGNYGLSSDELVQIIQILTPANFIHSVCTSSDYHLWQDTYNIRWGNSNLFLNFQMTDADELMITLDELESNTL